MYMYRWIDIIMAMANQQYLEKIITDRDYVEDLMLHANRAVKAEPL